MARDETDILGVKLDDSSDTNGDGGSDRQERVESINIDDDRPTLSADLPGNDPRGDLERATLERETVFDPTANMPEGMNIDTALVGMTDLDGNSIQMGPNRHGVGEDSILGEHGLGANSPFNATRNPFETSTGDSGPTWVGEGHKGPPPGFGGKYDDVSGKVQDAQDGFDAATKLATDAAAGAGKIARMVLNDVAELAALPETLATRFVQEFTRPEVTPPPPPPDKMDDGTGEGQMRLPTAQEVEAALKAKGGGTISRPVEGGNDGPQIGSGAPPPENPRYRGVTDPIDEAGTETGVPTATGLAGGAPAAPVINTINPDSGVNQPRQTSNAGTQEGTPGDITNSGEHGLTADIVAPGMSAPGITEVGSGDGASSIQSVDSSANAVDTSATEFLVDAPVERGIIIPDVGFEGDTTTIASFDPPMSADFSDPGGDLVDAEPEARDLLGNDPALDG